jgi:metallo-beta-lactamase class B
MHEWIVSAVAAAALATFAAAAPAAQTAQGKPHAAQDPSWTEKVPPLRIADRLYYVGSRELAAWLIDSGEGLILLDVGVPENSALVLGNIRALGFDPADVKLLLNSQAHFDHAGGLAAVKSATGARLAASRADSALLERGGRGDFAWGDELSYPAVAVDRIVADGEKLTIGEVTLTARITPGHTKGCTTWQLAGDKLPPALFLCGTTAPGYRLVGNRAYPNIASDFRRSFETWGRLPCELFLGAHASYFGMDRKRAALDKGASSNPFVDPTGCREFLRRSEKTFEAELAKQSADKPE